MRPQLDNTVEGKTGLSLAASQADAVRLALTSKALVITGGPGVGKTTIVNAILRILAAKGVTLLLSSLENDAWVFVRRRNSRLRFSRALVVRIDFHMARGNS